MVRSEERETVMGAVLGRDHVRIEGAAKVTGAALYSSDGSPAEEAGKRVRELERRVRDLSWDLSGFERRKTSAIREK